MIRRVADTQTPDLFEVPEPAAAVPAGLDYRAAIAHLVGELLRQADGDRHQVAAEMSRLTGKDVSKYMLDAYASEARDDFNVPLYLVPALETAVHSHVLTDWLVRTRGGRLLIGRDALNAELGRLERQHDQTMARIRLLKRVMGEADEPFSNICHDL